MRDTQDRLVAFIDIMGFKNRIARESPERVYEVMDLLHQVKEAVTEGSVVERNRGAASSRVELVQAVSFSDSMLLYAAEPSVAAATELMTAVAFVVGWSLDKCVPLKGAIAFGNFTADREKSIYFGAPLVDAYEQQESLQMYGVVLHHTCEKHLASLDVLARMRDDWNILQHATPFKNAGTILHYVVNWQRMSVGPFRSAPDSAVRQFYQTVSGPARVYVDHTLLLAMSIKKHLDEEEEEARRIAHGIATLGNPTLGPFVPNGPR